MSYAELARQMVDLHVRRYSEMSQMARTVTAGSEATILYLLLKGEGRPFAEDLARRTGLSAGRVASILKGLEARGLITRARDETNHRRYRVELTEAGHAAACEAERALLSSHEEVLRELGEDDAESLLRIVARLCDIYESRCSAGSQTAGA